MATTPDYYEVLGIPRSAKRTDVTRAYNRWVADFRKETTPPDPRREALLQEAYEVLVDDDRRDAYDAELARGPSGRKKGGAPVAAIAGVVLLAVAGGAAFFLLRSSGPAVPKARTSESLQMAMSGSVSPLVGYDISGKSTPAGLAFVIEDKVMVGNCQGLAPGALLVVNTGKRTVPARVTMADDALGLCKILTDGYVGEPLAVNSTPPAVGANVFSATIDAKGELGIRETKVTKVVDEGKGKAIQAAITPQPGGNGAPLLDAQGKVVAVATLQADGSTLHRVIPAGWLAENRVKLDEARPYQGGGGPGAATRTAGAAPGGKRYAPPLANTDYGCDCDFENDAEFQGRREARWKEISELPPGEREKAEKLELQGEEFVRKTMKDGNERMRRMAGGN